MTDAEELRFDVHPSVVFQLGADLVTDDTQALLELVKNCYDADASYAHIEIATRAKARQALEDSMYAEAEGFIKISDDGSGMDFDDIREGWLVVSNSFKRRLKASKAWSDRRVPLGDKGLGRLGSQRLGENLEIITSRQDKKREEHVGFSWIDFKDTETLGSVPVRFVSRTKQGRGRSGTTVLISGLSDPNSWRRPQNKEHFEQRLSELISPFEEVENFTLAVSIDGVELDLAKFGKKIRQEAHLTFSIRFDGKLMRVVGQAKLQALKPGGKRADLFLQAVNRDGGDSLLEFLKAQKQAKDFQLVSSSVPWFARWEKLIKLDSLDGAVLFDDQIANPGPFHGGLDSFSLARKDASQQEAFESIKDYVSYVKSLAGVRVYRDGFGIRVGRDFLELSKGWTSGRSWYGLRPSNTIGYIAISARHNPQLLEKTDREGFTDTAHHRNFRRLLEELRDFANGSLSFLRRATNEFCDALARERAEVTPDLSPEHLAEEIGQKLEKAGQLKTQLEKSNQRLEESALRIVKAQPATYPLYLSKSQREAAEKEFQRVQGLLHQAQTEIQAAQDVLGKIMNVSDRYNVLQSHIDRFNDRLAQVYETVGLGLTAEALSHEVAHIADGIGQRTTAVLRYMQSKSIEDKKLQAFVRHVNGAVTALRKQLAHLNPALRYARERREAVDFADFLEEIQEHHQERWRDLKLAIQIERLGSSPFTLKVNRGKLTQIFDNLILNSEYWLKEDLRLHRLERGVITVRIRCPHVSISDNGRGIDPSVEGSLFQAFVTTKKSGRGLGLFIVNEFLLSEGCSINLLPERNARDRLHIFELDLSGMMNGETAD